jgi:PhoPQ-activated pathogenicity-related protein
MRRNCNPASSPAARVSWRLAGVLLLSYALAQHAHAGELEEYVAAADASYSWHEVRTGHLRSAEYAEAILTSQTWRGAAWKHQLIVVRPAGLDVSSRQAFLFIDGGRWKPEYENGFAGEASREAGIFVRLANLLRAPVAIVRQVPFEPLFERREDALIAYSFDNYLNTGETDWPLLLPMVKSVSRAMDAVQQLVQLRWEIPIERFTVSGASKRGWTSWLVAAVDPRVASVAPMVIEMLNMPAQIDLQRETFGGLSKEIREYADIHLPERIDSAAGRKLVAIVDPYSYRDRLTRPKLILLGTNDPYWPVDALKLYWDGLPEEKRVLYLPNQTHDLRDLNRIIASLSALHRYSARGESLPRLSWTFTRQSERFQLTVRADRSPRNVLAWSANSATRDFRKARWTSHPCERSDERYVCEERIPRDHYSALYAEATFTDRDEPTFSLSTVVCIAGGPDANDTGC